MIIDNFEGEYRWLSNFWPAPFFSSLVEMRVPTVEHAYQALKTTDYEERIKVLGQQTPGQAKRMGRSVTMREDWDNIKYGMMAICVMEKFQQNSDLCQKLLDTGDAELIEGNTWGDTYWGVCCGVGENNLGKILMTLRKMFRDVQDADDSI